MKRIRIYILLVVVALVGMVAFGLGSRPQVKGAESDTFSAERVVKDIEVISRQHHSVAHPEERGRVRDYLVDRLKGLCADTVKLYEYKSLVGPENKHVVYTFDATNILAEFHPEGCDGCDNTSLMLIAHYDSRYSQPMPRQDTVWSYGAADDGCVRDQRTGGLWPDGCRRAGGRGQERQPAGYDQRIRAVLREGGQERSGIHGHADGRI